MPFTVATTLALALVALSSSAVETSNRPARAPVWHRDELPHAKPATAPQRIVSLAPVVTETLFVLGAGARVVGDTRFCDRPAEAKAIAKVGGFVDISLEQVLTLKPDLVIAMPSLGQRDVLDRLRERGVPVLVVFGDTLAEVHGLTRAIGDVVGAPAAAAKLEKALDEAASSLRTLAPPASVNGPLAVRQRAAVVVGTDPIVVAGPGTFAADAVTLAGFTLAVPNDGPMWPVWSPESLATSHVDVLVAAAGPDDAAKLNAVITRAFPTGKRPRVVASTGAILMRPGPSLVADLAELARLLDPRLDPRLDPNYAPAP